MLEAEIKVLWGKKVNFAILKLKAKTHVLMGDECSYSIQLSRHFVEFQPLIQLLFTVNRGLAEISHNVLVGFASFHHEHSSESNALVFIEVQQSVSYAFNEVQGTSTLLTMNFQHFSILTF